MPLVEVRRAIYAYTPADGDELAMREGDVLYILNNDDADWLQAKRKVLNIDDPEEQGLVPANHTELIKPITRAKGLYDYEPTLAEETTLNVDEEVDIVEDDDPDWYMAKTKGGYGFVPKAYVEIPASEPPAATISHFNVMLGKKKKAQKITLGVSNPTLIVDSNEDTVPPKRFAIGDISKCVVKKSVLTVEIGGYQPTTFDFNCTSNGEAERISDSINAARRGMFIGDRPLDVPQAKEAPASMPVQTMTIAQEHARVLYDFASDDSEELTVAEGD
ncbi:cytoskeletal protein binding protein, partial [Coemansia sp. RSA 2610]